MRFFPIGIIFIIFLFVGTNLHAQNDLPVFGEPEVKIKLKTDGPWSYDFAVSHRNLIYSDAFIFEEIQMELAHTTSYQLGENDKIGIGVKYRFRELFTESAQNELRFLQQYTHSHKYGSVKIAHRFRFEQRFREFTTFRTRYRLSADVPLGPDEKSVMFVPKAAILWSVAKKSKPSLENRFGFSFEKEISAQTTASLGLEYRHGDYTYDPEGEVFITGGIAIEI